jgi:hypothetical protein
MESKRAPPARFGVVTQTPLGRGERTPAFFAGGFSGLAVGNAADLDPSPEGSGPAFRPALPQIPSREVNSIHYFVLVLLKGKGQPLTLELPLLTCLL